MNTGRRHSNGIGRPVACALLWGAVALSFSGCWAVPEEAATGAGRIIPAVEAVEARLDSLPLVERLTGAVRARNQVAIHPRISAAVTEVLALNGQFVREGQPLVRLRDTEFRERLKQLEAARRIALAQARQAQAQLEEAQADRRRAERMAEQRLISESDLESARTRAVSAEAALELAEARVHQAEANLDEQEEALSQTVVRAPVSGTIGDKNAEVGMLVNSGTQLFTLGQLGSVRVEVVLTDRMLEYIRVGQRAEIFTDNGAAPRLAATVSRISPFLHPVAHTTVGEIDVENPGNRLRPGMFAGVDIYYGESEQATLVPLSALYENPATGRTGLYVSSVPLGAPGDASGGAGALSDPVLFEFMPVEIVARGRMHAGVRGIEPGRWVVTVGQNLFAGQSGEARVRAVGWDRIERLQQMQGQELLQEIMRRQQAERDTAS